ncbi:MAG: hypothetical protein E7672_06000 [Ruminococcaceae bacterium]|nr:hypothetical protein [Oscillospiraceae bacterium]
MSTHEDLSSIISKIVQNPEFAGMVSSIRGEENKGNSDDITKEMMSKLPDVLAMVSPMIDGGEKGAEEPSKENEKQAVQTILSDKTGNLKRYDKAKAEKLLRALKPYLNNGRGEIIDKCVSVMQVTDVMGALQGLDGISGNIKKNGGD